MLKTVDLFTRRYWQIAMVFMLFTFIQQFFHIPHDSWIIITSALIYSGFHPGTVLKRAHQRFAGTITGIAAVILIWHLMHLDYRLALIFFILICWALAFFAALPYNRYMIIVTMFSDILVEWNNPSDFLVEYYVVDRFMCTAIVFAICIMIEHLWFGRSNMTHLNFDYLRNGVKDDIRELYKIAQSRHLSRSHLYRKIQALNVKLDRLNMLMNDAVYENVHRHEFTRYDRQFGAQAIQTFRKVVSLYYLQTHGAADEELRELHMQAKQAINSL